MIYLKLLWVKSWPYIALIAAVFAAFFGVRQSGKSAGRQEIRQEINEAEAEAREKARHVEDTNAALSDADVDRRLDKWVRNK